MKIPRTAGDDRKSGWRCACGYLFWISAGAIRAECRKCGREYGMLKAPPSREGEAARRKGRE
jgi:hypothetical protein